MTADFLVEVGTEELPPKSLRDLEAAFRDGVAAGLDAAGIGHGAIASFASPRRLAVTVAALADRQPDRKSVQKGPPVSVAFDPEGNPLAPALAFAKKCGVAVGDLGRSATAKGEWLVCETLEAGLPARELLPGLVEQALASLPVARPMRWGEGEAAFVRPVHWLVMLYGDEVVEATLFGAGAGRETRGHRVHSKGRIALDTASGYASVLETEGAVIADFAARRRRIEAGVAKAAAAAGGRVVGDDALLDEVTALVEWPVPVTGSFDAKYLELPREVVISTLTAHQRFFPLESDDGSLLPRFVTVANLESRDPDAVRDGNERVIRPRLADAAFFWETDRKRTLESRIGDLEKVVYQQGLGSLHDKSERTAKIAASLADAAGADAASVRRAAMLAKCDLLTGMVGEFPDLQGVMGGHYARADGEPAAVADAVAEHYRPRFAGDAPPSTRPGQLLAVADKLDTLAGVFALGKRPSGNRDPYGLRRAALGVVRILVECRLDLDVYAAIAGAVRLQPPAGEKPGPVAKELSTFVEDRLKSYFLDRDPSLAAGTFDAVMARRPTSLVDFEQRLEAVQAFSGFDEASSLAAANKRIANILRQADGADAREVEKKLLREPAEMALYESLARARSVVRPLLGERRYTDALRELAALREPVDTFFDDVMVMADDSAVRDNRLALLGELRALFLDVADVSRLSVA